MIFQVQELTTRTSVELCNQTHLYLSRHTPSGQVAHDSQTCAHIDANEPHAGLQRKFNNLVVKAFWPITLYPYLTFHPLACGTQ